MKKKRNYWTIDIAMKCALKFNNKRDFKKNYIGAYEVLRKNKLLDDACSHMTNLKHKKKWTREECIKIALNYNSLLEFKNENSWGYVVALKNDWIDEITSHMKKKEKPKLWTKEKCTEIAGKYNRRNEFKINNSKAYYAAYRNGWLNNICSHMIICKGNYKWTKEKCKEIANKYDERNVFRKTQPNTYYAVMYNGWLDDVCSHMKYKKQPNKYWHDFKNCKQEALKYKTKSEFIKKSQHVYNISLKNGWVDEICKHMTPIGDRFNKCIYVYLFSDNNAYVGLTYNLNIRIKSRKYDNKDSIMIHRKKTGLVPEIIQLTKYIPVDEVIKLEEFYYLKYLNDGWNMLNRKKTGGIGSRAYVWNFNRIRKISLKYKNIDDFKIYENELYNISKKEGWLNSLFN